jgi:hypothetical protein
MNENTNGDNALLQRTAEAINEHTNLTHGVATGPTFELLVLD